MRVLPTIQQHMHGHRHGTATVDVMPAYRRHDQLIASCMKSHGLLLPLLEDRVLRLTLDSRTSEADLQKAYLESCMRPVSQYNPFQVMDGFFDDLIAAFNELWGMPPWSLSNITILDAQRKQYLADVLVVEITYLELPSDGIRIPRLFTA